MRDHNEQSSKDIFYNLKGGKYDKQNTKGLLAFRAVLERIVKFDRIPNTEYIRFLKNDRIPNSAIRT